MCHRRPGSLLISAGGLGPASHLSAATPTMIITSNSLAGAGAQSVCGDLRHTMNQLRATHVRNRTSKFADNPMPCATSIQSTASLRAIATGDRTATTHSRCRNRRRQSGIASVRGVSRLDQQETKKCVALLADVPEACRPPVDSSHGISPR